MKKSLYTGLILLLLATNAIATPKPLVVHWFGTASYLIQFGKTSILTDPFYSQHNILQVGIGWLDSSTTIVNQVASDLKHFETPKAIFIGHSHYDHMLDTASLVKTAKWGKIPIIGSLSTKNILACYDDNLEHQVQLAKTDKAWHQVAPGVRYQAIKAEHADNVPGLLFYQGQVKTSLSSTPDCARDFKLGQTYAYVFELTDGPDKALVYFVGAATTAPIGFPNENIKTVDLAILCVPSWQYTEGYPEAFIDRLHPSYILPSHYNDFFQDISDLHQPRRILWIAQLAKFLHVIKQHSHYSKHKKTLQPKVNDTIILHL